MTQIDREAKNSQQYISQSGSISSGQTIYILNGDTTIRTLSVPKNVQYMYYTSPSVSSNYKFSTSSGSNSNSNSGSNTGSTTSISSTTIGNNSSSNSTDEIINKFISSSSNKINALLLFVLALLI